MKIYILQPSDEVRPLHGFRAPAHNADYGVEQGFYDWLVKSPYVTYDPTQADYDYAPIWYNKFYCNHWGSDESVAVLQNEILRLVSRNRPTFTIVEYGIKTLQPTLDLCSMTIFTAGRMAEDDCIDIPLLCSLHAPAPEPEVRQWRASFMGKFETSAYREQMREALAGRDDVYLSAGVSTEAYVKLLADTDICLAPRGFTGNSFRFYECMQFGCVPFLIGDLDTRPFKQWIDWDAFSLYTSDAAQIPAMIDALTIEDTQRMGELARVAFYNQLYYGRWEQYVIKQLKAI